MRRVAIGDIGTNTARLLVADVHGGHVTEVETQTQVVGLGRGLHATGELQDDAIERAVAGLAAYGPSFAAADEAIIVATSASRDASNREDFFTQVETRAGVRPTLISGEQEAAYAFAGASQALPDDQITVIDIGGGSTEAITGHKVVEESVSVDVGSVRMTDLHLGPGPVDQDTLRRARRVAEEALAHIPRSGSRIVGVAGTITTVSATLLGLSQYDRSAVHLSEISLDAATDLLEKLASLDTKRISHYATIGPKRAPVIVGGLVVLESIMIQLGATELVVSERDLLHGVAATL